MNFKILQHPKPVLVSVYQRGRNRHIEIYGVMFHSTTIKAGSKSYFLGCGGDTGKLFIKYETRNCLCGEVQSIEILKD